MLLLPVAETYLAPALLAAVPPPPSDCSSYTGQTVVQDFTNCILDPNEYLGGYSNQNGIAPDRTVTTTAPDGTIITTAYVGGKLTKTTFLNATDGTSTEKWLNGPTIITKPDGTKTTQNKDRSWYMTFPQKPDGSVDTYYENGTTITNYPNGRTVIH